MSDSKESNISELENLTSTVVVSGAVVSSKGVVVVVMARWFVLVVTAVVVDIGLVAVVFGWVVGAGIVEVVGWVEVCVRVGAGDTGGVEGWVAFVVGWVAADINWVVPIESCCVVIWFVKAGLECSWDVVAAVD